MIRLFFILVMVQFQFFFIHGQATGTDNKAEIPSDIDIDVGNLIKEKEKEESTPEPPKKLGIPPVIEPFRRKEPKSVGDSLVIDDFERVVQWKPYFPRDYGFLTLKHTQLKKNLLEEMSKENSNQKGVLGIKISYFMKGFFKAYLRPPSPIEIPGISQEFSIWIRTLKNGKHKIYVSFEDSLGRKYKSYFRTYNTKISSSYRDEDNKYLKTSGLVESNFEWRRYTAKIKQSNWKNELAQKGYIKGVAPVQRENQGITFKALVLESNIESSYGTYYIYLDQFMVKSKIEKEKEDGIASDW